MIELLLPTVIGSLFWLLLYPGAISITSSNNLAEESTPKHKITYALPDDEKVIVEGEFVDGFLTTGEVVFRYESLCIDDDIRLEGSYEQSTSTLSDVSVVLQNDTLSYVLPSNYSFVIYNDYESRKIMKRPPKDSNRDTMWELEYITTPNSTIDNDSMIVQIHYPTPPISHHWRDVATWLKRSREEFLRRVNCEIMFPNGNEYKGVLFDDQDTMVVGEYLWKGGDTFVGAFSRYFHGSTSTNPFEEYEQIIPIEGELELKDGEIHTADSDFFNSFVKYVSHNTHEARDITPSEYLPIFQIEQEKAELQRQEEEKRRQEEERKKQEEWNGYIQNKEETIEQFLSLFVDEKNKTSFTIDDQLSLFELAAIYLIFNTNQGATIERGFASYSLESTTILNGKMTIGLKNHYDTTVGTTEKEVKRVWFGTCDPKRELKEFTCAKIELPKLYNLEFGWGGEYSGYTLKTPLSSSRIETIEKWSKEFWIEMYGPTLGSAVYYKEVQLGMTIDMIRAIKGSNGSLSTRVYSDDEVYQTLSYGGYGWFDSSYERYEFYEGRLISYSRNE